MMKPCFVGSIESEEFLCGFDAFYSELFNWFLQKSLFIVVIVQTAVKEGQERQIFRLYLKVLDKIALIKWLFSYGLYLLFTIMLEKFPFLFLLS